MKSSRQGHSGQLRKKVFNPNATSCSYCFKSIPHANGITKEYCIACEKQFMLDDIILGAWDMLKNSK